jgi:2-polyprenyl-3-methyl-5-hydroxy-6-metoxy-1,4-benzoquinol methylase
LCCLDAGCGSGYGTHYLAETSVKEITGVDISSVAIQYAKKNYSRENLHFLQMDVRQMSFNDNSFDGVVTFEVLEHLDEKGQMEFVCELARVLKDEGVVYLGCPNAVMNTGNNRFHEKELTIDQLRYLLQRYFCEVRILGQKSLLLNDTKGKLVRWLEGPTLPAISESVISDENVEEALGFIAECKVPKSVTGEGR